MRKKLGYPAVSDCTPSSASKALVEWYHTNHTNILENIEARDHSLTTNGIVYPVFIDPATQIIVTGDLILTKSLIQRKFKIAVPREGSEFCCVFFHSTMATPHQEYKTMACLFALSNNSSIQKIDKTRAVVYCPSKGTCKILHLHQLSVVRKKFLDYLEWYHQVEDVDHMTSKHPFLYPNMKYMEEMDDKGAEWKTKWAYEINEITLLPSVKPVHRGICDNFEMLWNDPGLLEQMQLYPRGITTTITRMLALHFDSSGENVLIGDREELEKQCLEWSRCKCCLFVDFETVDNQIYMIGIGKYDSSNGFQYECLVSESLSPDHLQELMHRFEEYLGTMIMSIDKIFYWYAEVMFLKNSDYTQDLGLLTKYEWVDVCSVFRKNPVLIRHCFNFKLKNIWKWMRASNLIQTEQPPEDCCNGQQSVEIAKRYYSSRSETLLETLISYNQFDCRVMFDILWYFKSM